MDALQVVKAEVASAIVVKTESATVMVLDSSDEEANPQSIEVQRSEDVSEAEQQVKVNELGELHVVGARFTFRSYGINCKMVWR